MNASRQGLKTLEGISEIEKIRFKEHIKDMGSVSQSVKETGSTSHNIIDKEFLLEHG